MDTKNQILKLQGYISYWENEAAVLYKRVAGGRCLSSYIELYDKALRLKEHYQKEIDKIKYFDDNQQNLV